MKNKINNMYLNVKNGNLYGINFKDRFLLYDINRVKVYNASEVEKDLLKKGNSLSIDPLIEKYGRETVSNAIERLNRLSRMSESLAGYDGCASYYIGSVTYLYLNISNACNLNCHYCYARDGSYEKGPAFMTEEIVKAGIDFFTHSLYPNRQGVIVFTGGEPFLNFKVIQKAVAYAISKQNQKGVLFSFRILTNGTIMNQEILKFLSDYNIWIQISLDGPADIHNIHRKDKEGVGTFNKVNQNISFIKKNNFRQFSIRSTVHHQSADTVVRIVNFFDSQGFKNYIFSPVMSNNKSLVNLNKDDIQKLVTFYHDRSEKVVADIKRGAKKRIPEDFALYVEKLKKGIKTKRFCGAGKDLVVLTPSGEFYPCPSLVSVPKFRFGSLREGINKQIQLMFNSLSSYKKETCKKCWARNLCGGGCIYLAYDVNQDLSIPDPSKCEIIKAKIKGAINVYNQFMN